MEIFGENYFTLIDAWDASRIAIGFTRKDKLIYISTNKHWHLSPNNVKCYAEFEIIDEHTLMPVITTKCLENITKEELVVYIKEFMNGVFSLN